MHSVPRDVTLPSLDIVDAKRRPKFRYGSGKWGQALFRVSIHSSLTNNVFHAFALPDPEEIHEDWFEPSMLVPVLIGMDFIDGNALVAMRTWKETPSSMCLSLQQSQIPLSM